MDSARSVERKKQYDVEGAPALSDATPPTLANTGTTPAPNASDLTHSLDDRYPRKHPSPPPRPGRKSPAATVLLAYLYDQVQVLTEQGQHVRHDTSAPVHTMRISTRRVRSALATYLTLCWMLTW